SLRRTFTNSTGQPVTQLRFRVVDITTQGSTGSGLADLRLLSNSDVTVTRMDSSTVTLKSLDVEEPPTQSAGGGLNSTVAVVSITPAAPLAPGTSVSVQFTLGVQQSGNYRIFVNTEATTAAPAGPPFIRKLSPPSKKLTLEQSSPKKL
ncbi:MAG TPA: hypothetical protein VE821_02030, partial [Pyrinomonadaceae bacterium]|nr:hypothetical protein [Pyrinomonadaceae bacterium]